MIKRLPTIYLCAFFLLTAAGLSAQADFKCGTGPEEQSSTPAFVDMQRAGQIPAPRTGVFEVPVQFHIIGAINGAFAIDSNLVLDELLVANEYYLDAGIQFVHCNPINFIYNNSLLTFVKNQDEWICDQQDVPNVINIYFVPNLEDNDEDGLCGYAYNFDNKPRVLMQNSCSFNGSTLAHELGHSFSLLHTHSTSNGHELVDGSNCANAGDLLCDTPADPRLSSDVVNSNCEYTGTEVDDNDMPYEPDTGNFMSYSRKNCRDHFSMEQIMQIADYYAVYGDLLECSPLMTSTEELAGAATYKVFPNPTSGSVTIKSLEGPVEIELFGADGRLLWRGNSDGQADYDLLVMEQLPAGLYHLQVHGDQGRSTQKLVKL